MTTAHDAWRTTSIFRFRSLTNNLNFLHQSYKMTCDSKINLFAIISCDYLNLSLANEYVGDVTIPTQVIKYNQNFLQVDQPIRLQYSNQIKLLNNKLKQRKNASNISKLNEKYKLCISSMCEISESGPHLALASVLNQT